MSSPRASRPYDLVHLGATGYTGAYVVTHVCNTLPSNLTWAIAGRSQSKLEAIVEDLRKRFPDRRPPSVEVCRQDEEEIDQLAAKAKVIISTVGPYCRYGEPVIKACAKHGTGYVDATGEVPWVKEMVSKYHEQAKSTGAIIIPQCALESAFSDLLVYALTTQVRDSFGVATKSITSLVWDMKSAPSGGTLATVFSIFEMIPTKQLMASMKPYALSPVPRPSGTYPARGGLGRFSGMMQVPKLGLAVDAGAIMGITNAAIVWRTWGLFQQAAAGSAPAQKPHSTTSKEGLSYGPDFHYTEAKKASGRLNGLLYHLAMSTFPVFLLFSPLRWLLKRLVFQPGQGPTEAATANDTIEIRGIAQPAGVEGAKHCVVGSAKWYGSMYDITGLFLANAAKVILQIYKEEAGEAEASSSECYARRWGGGVLTPACLGEDFLEGAKAGGYNLALTVDPK